MMRKKHKVENNKNKCNMRRFFLTIFIGKVSLFLLFFSFNVPSLASKIETDVLIVGGGPVGLTFAHFCSKNNIKFYLAEKNNGPCCLSKATGLHPNSMSIFHKLNLVDDILDTGTELKKSIIIHNHKVVKEIFFQYGKEKYEKNISISQNYLEKILSEKIEQEKLLYRYCLRNFEKVEENKYLSTLTFSPEKNKAYEKQKYIISKFIIGADGARSTVRKQIGAQFPGETTPELSFSFDGKLQKHNFEKKTMYMISNNFGRIVFVPLGCDMFKISGKLPTVETDVTLDVLSKIVYERTSLKVIKDTITGIVTYHTHSRIADKLFSGHVFLIGDAAHVFYPAGGYGLNLGVKEAYNLGLSLKNYLQDKNDTYFHSFYLKSKEESKKIQNDATKKKELSHNLTPEVKVEIEEQAYET